MARDCRRSANWHKKWRPIFLTLRVAVAYTKKFAISRQQDQ